MTWEEFKQKFPHACPMGFNRTELEEYFGAKEGKEHPLWEQLTGQTGAICTGQRYSYERQTYYPDGECYNSPHGFISYAHDVFEWYTNKPVSDW